MKAELVSSPFGYRHIDIGSWWTPKVSQCKCAKCPSLACRVFHIKQPYSSKCARGMRELARGDPGGETPMGETGPMA